MKAGGHHTPYAARICRYLVESGHQVTFITTRGHGGLDAFPDADLFTVEFIRVLSEPDPFPEWSIPGMTTVSETIQQHQGLRLAEQSDVDVLHLPTLDHTEFPFRMAASGSPPPFPIVASVHRDRYEVGIGSDVVNHWGVRSCLRKGILSTVFVHAEPMAVRIKGAVPEANGRNVRTVPYPTPDPPTDLSQTAARDQLDLPRDVPLLLFFASHRYEQGPDLLLDAVREFDESVAVVFAGSPGYVMGDDLEAFKANDGGEARIVNRLEWVPEEDVYPYFAAADASMLPFRRTRGVSETLNRACLTDTHPIASDDSDIGYIVERYDLGQTFERGSVPALRTAVRTFLKNRDEYPLPAIEEYGRSQLNERTGERLERAYQAVLDDTSRRVEAAPPERKY